MRPLVLIDQEDTQNRTIGHTYLFGDAFLVAPMLAAGTGPRAVRLPRGDWLDFWDHSPHAGRAEVTWSNPDRMKFPLYIRRGAIVPMLPESVDTLCDANYVNHADADTWDGSLLLRIYPSGISEFTVYDGTKITCQSGAGAMTVTIKSAPRTILLQIAAPEPAKVTRDGNPVPKKENLDAVSSGWRFGPDPLKSAVQFLFIKFPHTGGTNHITF
jgi:alpha-glucosidase (family GH31 glycosyl hydrolase)